MGGTIYKFGYSDKSSVQKATNTNTIEDSSKVINNTVTANDNNKIEITTQGENKNNTNTSGVQFNNNGSATYNDNRKTTNSTVNLNAKAAPRQLTNHDIKTLDSLPKGKVINVRFHSNSETVNYANSVANHLMSQGFKVTKTVIGVSDSVRGYTRFGIEENIFGEQNTIDLVIENQ